MKQLRNLLIVILCIYSAWLLTLYLVQRSMIYPGTAIKVPTLPPVTAGMELLRLNSGEGEVEALLLPPINTRATSAPGPALIFAHGNGEVIDYWVDGLNNFRERGMAVLLVEYPGYGRSTGTPSEDSIRRTLIAAYDRLASDPRINPAKIIGYGQSLGGGAICTLATNRPLAAVILQSTFPSLDIFTAGYGAPAFLLRDRFDNETVLKKFPGPVLVLHGSTDSMIPWQLGERLAAASKQATFRLHSCGHMCQLTRPIWNDIEQFLNQANIR